MILLLANPSTLNVSDLILHAFELKLDRPRFEACVNGGKFRRAVESDYQDGVSVGVNGTPAFFINGIFLNGNQPMSEFVRVVEDELAAAGVKPSGR